jgi:prepilin-type N-terminal cleavage/methylation domain-containing protein
MFPLSKPRNERGFLTLIELLVVLAIILGFFWVFTGGGGKPSRPGGPTTTPGMAIEQAKNLECRTELSQVRQAIQIYKLSSDGKPPASLDDLRLPYETTHCPVGKQQYVYDPQTGQVHCSTPGHERY